MKPTCPTSCPLKEAMNRHRESEAMSEEFRWTMEQLSPINRWRALAVVIYLQNVL